MSNRKQVRAMQREAFKEAEKKARWILGGPKGFFSFARRHGHSAQSILAQYRQTGMI